MMKTAKPRRAEEFGDFQTPFPVAKEICRMLSKRGLAPDSIVEPSCGFGNLLLASMAEFPSAGKVMGLEIHGPHLEKLRAALATRPALPHVALVEGSFFDQDWPALLAGLREPILVLGNPPWVTNAGLGALASPNLPKKANFQGLKGLDALTGKSNFDISEWMILALLTALSGRDATLAMLCKTSVARKVLAHAWGAGLGVVDVEIRGIDALETFGAAVDACLLLCTLTPSRREAECLVFRRLGDASPTTRIGFRDRLLIADLDAYARQGHLASRGGATWRSGIKHDCSRLMEFRREAGGFRNGEGEVVDLEFDYMFPMLKSSEITQARAGSPSRWMLVPQRLVGDDTSPIQSFAPNTWAYLQAHGESLDRRSSTIYRGRPRFSVFGVGDYSFAPWKVAISRFYKRLDFTVVGEFAEQPIVLDDTAYFLPCRSRNEAVVLASLLNSSTARDFYSAFVFWDAKRPITAEILRRLDISALAREMGIPWGPAPAREMSNGMLRRPTLLVR